MTDQLRVLLPDPNHQASKRFRWVGDQRLELEASYDAGWQFRQYAAGELEDIYDLAETLRRVESSEVDRGLFVIRGTPREGVDDGDVVNRQYKERNDAPDWQPHPEGRRWLMVDIDDLGAPGWLERPVFGAELDRAVEYATDRLPECFREATTFYQWSSSAGLESLGEGRYELGWSHLRLHLWYWLDRPVCSASAREWLKSWRDDSGVPVDWRLFNPVQPHFIAPPTFRGGGDPLGDDRSELLEKPHATASPPDEVVDRPTYLDQQRQREEARKRRRRQVRQAPRVRSRAQMKASVDRYASAALERACEAVASTPKGARETNLRDEAYSIGGLVGAGALEEGEALQRLVEAGVSAGLPREESVDKASRALEAGKESPRDLTEVRRELPDEGDAPGQCDDSGSGPDIDSIREHLGDARRAYTPPDIERQGAGAPLTDALMGDFGFDDWMRLVERIRREHPGYLPDSSMLPAA